MLSKYINSKAPIDVECLKCGCKWTTTPYSLFKGHGCVECFNREKRGRSRALTQAEFIEAMYKLSPLIEVQGEYIDTRHKIKWKCNGCGRVRYTLCSDLLHGHWCKKCRGQPSPKRKSPEKFVEEVKQSQVPWTVVSEYVKDTVKVKIQCKNCGYIHEARPSNILRNACSCPVCGDGVSYPNKFSRKFIQQLPVDNVIYEYSPDWIKPKRFDNYFEYNNQAYILEMDGNFHYITNNFTNQSLEERQRIDNEKETIAKSKDIKVIRIDCRKSQEEYIRNNIINSELSEIFDLSNINWQECHKYATKNIIYEVYNYYQQIYSEERFLKDMIAETAKQFHISQSTVKHYLEKAKSVFPSNLKEVK